MRIVGLRIEAFGALKAWAAEDLGAPVVVVRGDNESGKTSLFRFLSALLYGFHPANQEDYPYVPWDGGIVSGEGRFLLADGEEVTVARRLLRQPRGELTRRDRTEDIRNRPVPFAAHVPRPLFEDLYTITLAGLSFPSGRVWDELQDRLLGGTGVSFLRPTRLVVEELEREASRLWRPDRRGKPEDKQLRELFSALRESAAEAARRDAQIRAKVHELEEKRERLEQLKEQRVKGEALLHRANVLNPVRKRLQRIRELEETAGDLQPFAHVPEDPLRILRELEDREASLQGQLAELHERRERWAKALSDLGAQYVHVLERESDIAGWLRQAEHLAREMSRLETIKAGLPAKREALAEAAADLLTEPWREDMEDPLARVPRAELRSRLRELAELEERLAEAEAERRAAENRAEGLSQLPRPPWAEVTFLAALTALLVAFSLWSDSTPYLAFAGAVGAYALYRVWNWQRAKAEQRARRQEAESRLVEARRKEEAVRARLAGSRRALQDLFGDLPVAPSRLVGGESLLLDVQAIQAKLEDLRQLRQEEESLSQSLAEAREELYKLAADCGLEVEGDPLALITRLERALEEAREKKESARRAEDKLADLEEEGERLQRELREVQAKASELREVLAELGDDDVNLGASRLKERRMAAEMAEKMHADLMVEFPDLEEIRAQIREMEETGQGWVFDDEEVDRVRVQVTEAQDEIANLREDIARLEKDIEQLKDGPTLDLLRGEMKALEARRRRVWSLHDRLTVLRVLLLEADRRFREEHQPDVLRRAGRYLEVITDGRYDRLVLDEEEGTLRLRRSGFSFTVPADEPVSRGTLDQVYLALRLALVGHLDSAGERLPLFLDEVLVNWDASRRDRGLKLLDEVSRERQVFLFTCHRWLVEELCSRLDAAVVDMPEVG